MSTSVQCLEVRPCLLGYFRICKEESRMRSFMSRPASSLILHALTSLAQMHPLPQRVQPFKALLQSCFSWFVALTGFLCITSLALPSSLHPGKSDLPFTGRPFVTFSLQTCSASQRLSAPFSPSKQSSSCRGISSSQKGSSKYPISFSGFPKQPSFKL